MTHIELLDEAARPICHYWQTSFSSQPLSHCYYPLLDGTAKSLFSMPACQSKKKTHQNQWILTFFFKRSLKYIRHTPTVCCTTCTAVPTKLPMFVIHEDLKIFKKVFILALFLKHYHQFTVQTVKEKKANPLLNHWPKFSKSALELGKHTNSKP